MFGQGGLSAAVMAENGHKGALFNGDIHAIQNDGGDALLGGVGEAEIYGFNDFGHVVTSQ